MDSVKDKLKVDIVTGVWSFKRKRTPTGELLKYKARLCAHGGQQRHLVSFDETYAPVVNWFVLHTLLTISLIKGWKSKQLNMVLAYPQADVKTNIYMKIPFGLKVKESGDKKDYLLKLKRNIYRLKDAGRTWGLHLCNNLIAREFEQSKVDLCLFY